MKSTQQALDELFEYFRHQWGSGYDLGWILGLGVAAIDVGFLKWAAVCGIGVVMIFIAVFSKDLKW